jgi:membrane-associated phospholipid phosphatase
MKDKLIKIFIIRYNIMIQKTFEGFERGYPLIILFSLFMSYFMTHKIDFLIFGIALSISSLLNQLLKEFVFNPIMKENLFPILGKGTRPEGAQDCSNFIDPENRISSSYGMPSGHAQTATFFATYFILMIINERSSKNIKILKIITVLIITGIIMSSRVYLGCHTIQQVVVGGIIGGLLGYLFFANMDKIKGIFKI